MKIIFKLTRDEINDSTFMLSEVIPVLMNLPPKSTAVITCVDFAHEGEPEEVKQ